jgi:hypothetical protein
MVILFTAMGSVLSSIGAQEDARADTPYWARGIDEPEQDMIDEVVQLTCEQQAKIADPVCQANASSEEFCTSQIAGFIDNPRFELWNYGSIGNVAYLALNAATPKVRSECETLRQQYIKWHAAGGRYSFAAKYERTTQALKDNPYA